MFVGTLIKQPNEKYCVVNYSGEVVSYNLTEEDIIKLYIEDAKSHIGTAKHYVEIIEKTDEVSDGMLKEMGFDRPYNELVKYVPRKPTNQSYAPCDFATYGKCPNCGGTVIDSIGGKDEKCRSCGQMLKWI